MKLSSLKSDTHTGEVIRGASIALMLKLLAAGLLFLMNVALARLLGADEAGLYFLSFTIITIVATISRFGMDNALVRFIAASAVSGDWVRIKGVYLKATKLVISLSILLSIILFIFAPWLAEYIFRDLRLGLPLQIMAVAVLPFALFTIHAQALQGLKKIRDSIFVLSVSAPLLTIIFLYFLVPLAGVNGASAAYVIAANLTLVCAFFLWRRNLRGNEQGFFDLKELFDSSIPLFFITVLNLTINWLPVLVLGGYGSSGDVGIFSIAHRTAMLTSFVLVAVNSIAAPKFAALYKKNDIVALSLVARNSTKIMVLLSFPILCIFLFFPQWILFIFGKEFTEGANALAILALGQFVNVATGSVGYLLMMSGNEKIHRNNLSLACLICALLSFVLIPIYGIIGAAIASSISLASQNIFATIMVKKKLGIEILFISKS